MQGMDSGKALVGGAFGNVLEESPVRPGEGPDQEACTGITVTGTLAL